MPLATGTRLGPYEVGAPLGAGGMGEVYRARDTRLDRSVALKVLPTHLSADATARERFEREARSVAALSHPHICTLHDVGDHEGTSFLVMECLEGETLAARLERGALPLNEALGLSTQILSALRAAHRAGIVHRDLKPGNIMLVPSSTRSASPTTKLLDFGLAKPAAPVLAPGAAATLTRAPITGEGAILGTFQYMAPEQIEGLEADTRADIFAFGCVLYEMVTGRRAFDGKTAASVIAAVLGTEPRPIVELQPLSPPLVDWVVARCLAKDRDERWQSITDLQAALDRVTMPAPSTASSAAAATPRRWATGAVVGLAGLLAGAAMAWLGPRDTPAMADPVTFVVDSPGTLDPTSLALSPDGRHLAYVAPDDGVSRLWVRALVSMDATALPGTDGAMSPFWSPDSRTIGFFTQQDVKRVDLGGGAPRVLARASGNYPLGATWTIDRQVIFSKSQISGLFQVGEQGGEARPLTRVDVARERFHGFPVSLTEGRLLYAKVLQDGTTLQDGTQELWLRDGETERMIGTSPGGVSSLAYTPGYLIAGVEDTMMAQRFDATSGVLSPGGFPVAASVGRGALGLRAFALTNTVMAYRAGLGPGGQLAWLDRTGSTLSVVGDAGPYRNLSADRTTTRVTFDRDGDVWVFDASRAHTTRVTFDAANQNDPAISPDGTVVAYFSSTPKRGIYVKPSDASGAETLLTEGPPGTYPRSFTPDGRQLVYASPQGTRIVSLADRRDTPLLTESSVGGQAQFAPAGRYLAFTSTESGRSEIYVVDYPPTGAKWRLSTDGGSEPRWRADGRELFYLAADGRIMAVDVTAGPGFTHGEPRPLFPTRLMEMQGFMRRYAVSPDGQRFLLNAPPAVATSPITVVLNWRSLLERPE